MVDKHRAQRISDQMQREIGTMILREMSDPRVQLVSVSHVDVSRDLAFAKVYFTVLGEQNEIDLAQEALDNAAGFLRNRLAEEMNLRKTPKLTFIYDKSSADGLRLSAKIDAAIAADENKNNFKDH
ncbi:MAG: 30S ribosome-binding factor RbfA [Gammaproteobacteria bacterium]|nr:30S ribosome-binding factor RbfA [Gammaproteobacteria bacterium]